MLAVDLEPGQSLATLRPLCAGPDMAANLRAHLDLLRAEGLLNFQVEIDTGRIDARWCPRDASLRGRPDRCWE